MATKTDVLILGAGIAGLSLALHLGERSRESIVLDPRSTAAGATGRAAGIITEQVWNDWDVAVIREAHREAERLLIDVNPPAYWRNGFVRWTGRSELAEPFESALSRLSAAGATVRSLDASQLRQIYPGGRFPDSAIGLHSPLDACVNPSALAEAYARAASRIGARSVLGFPVPTPRFGNGEWIVQVGAEEFRAMRLVVAAGAWSKRILEEIGTPLPLCPYRTQAALLRPSGPPFSEFPSIHDVDSDVYVRPEVAGRILAGDGTESVESDPERFVPGGDPEFVAHLAERLAPSFPGWGGGALVSAWAGVCTATPDRRPLVGAVPGARELYVISGFNGFGIMRAGGVSRLLADRITGGPVRPGATDPLAPVRPDRFPGAHPPFPPTPGFTLEAGEHPRF